jgi:hypothetical protein
MATAKWNNVKVCDSGLTYIANSATHIYVVTASLSATPTYAECTSTQALTGATALSVGSIAVGDAGGQSRKIPINAHSGITVTASGTAAGVAIVRSVDSTVCYTTTLASSVAVTSGGSVNVAAWDIEIGAAA